MAREGSRPATMSSISMPAAPPVSPSSVSTPAAAPAPTPVPASLTPGYVQSSSLFHAFQRCWLLASTLGLLVGGTVGTLWWLSIPEQHSAEIRIRVPLLWSGAAGESTNEEQIGRFQRTQVAMIQSTSVLEAVLQRPEVAQLSSIREETDPLAWLGNHLTVGFSSIPDVLLLRVNGTQAEDAVVLARTIAEVYRQTVTNQRQSALHQLQETRKRTEELLHRNQHRLAQLENSRLGTTQKELQQAQFNLRVARAELADQERRRPLIEKITVSEQTILAFLKDDSVSRKHLQEIESVEEQIKTVLRVSALKERDPELPALYRLQQEARKKLAARQAEVRPLVLRNQRDRAMDEFQTQLNQRGERVAFCEGLVKSLEDETQRLGDDHAAEEMKTLSEEVTAANETLRRLTADRQHLESAPSPAEVSQAGEMVALQRLSPKGRLQAAGLGGSGCCALLMLAVSWRELRLRRITSSSDIASGLGLPVLGNVPLKGRKSGVAREQLDGGSSISEAVDALRTVLLRDNGNGSRLLLVTSAVGGEGKTSLAALLAASLARAWRKTLLVDADLRKPAVHHLFSTQLEPGLCEVLRAEAETADVIQPTELGRLWMIPAGHCDSHAIQALAQDGMGGLFDPLREQFDFIIVDACSLFPAADALLLSTHVDGVLLALRSGVSRLPVVQAAQQRLLALDAPLRGAVLIGPDSDLHSKLAAFSRRAS